MGTSNSYNIYLKFCCYFPWELCVQRHRHLLVLKRNEKPSRMHHPLLPSGFPLQWFTCVLPFLYYKPLNQAVPLIFSNAIFITHFLIFTRQLSSIPQQCSMRFCKAIIHIFPLLDPWWPVSCVLPLTYSKAMSATHKLAILNVYWLVNRSPISY